MIPGIAGLVIYFVAFFLIVMARKEDLKKYWIFWWGKLIIIGVTITWTGASVANILSGINSSEENRNAINNNTDSVVNKSANDVKTHNDSALIASRLDPHKAELMFCAEADNNGKKELSGVFVSSDSVRLRLAICNVGGGTAFDLQNNAALIEISPGKITLLMGPDISSFSKLQRIPGGAGTMFYQPFRYYPEWMQKNETRQYYFWFRLKYRDDLKTDTLTTIVNFKVYPDGSQRTPNAEIVKEIEDFLRSKNIF